MTGAPPPRKPPPAPGLPAAVPPPLRVTRRGLIRLAQLGATAGALGVAAVSCGLRLESGGAADAAGPARLLPVGRGAAPAGADSQTGAATVPGVTPSSAPSAVPGAGPSVGASGAAAGLPGVGPTWTARLAGHDQVVLVTSGTATDTRNVVRWFDRAVAPDGSDGSDGSAAGWVLRATVAGWNGVGGWTTRHTVGDGRSPTGLYALTDAGGYDPNPGTALPYQHSPSQYSEMLHGVRTFAHVLAIDYNRVAGTPPSNAVRPGGWSRGGSIWVHVAHDSPTQACVGIADVSLVALLRWLRPAAHPVILMGPAAVLAT